jgi:hypothetical protein
MESMSVLKKPQNETARERERVSEWVSEWVKEEIASFDIWGYECGEYQDDGLLRYDTV